MRDHSVQVGSFPVRDKWFILCRVQYVKGRGYFFVADPCEDMGDGVIAISMGMCLAGRMALLKEAKRFSQKTFDELATRMNAACRMEDLFVMKHVAEATERLTQETARVPSM
jgi:hypothetical protein